MDVHAVKSLKGSSSPRDGCGGAHFQRDCNDRLAKVNRASHGPRERAKEGVKKTRENPKDSSKKPEMPKARTRVSKIENRSLLVLENSKSWTSSETQESAQQESPQNMSHRQFMDS